MGVHACRRVNESSIPTSTAPPQPESTRGAPAGGAPYPLRPRAADRPSIPVCAGRLRRPRQRTLPDLGRGVVPAARRAAVRQAVSYLASMLSSLTLRIATAERLSWPALAAALPSAPADWDEVDTAIARFTVTADELDGPLRRLLAKHREAVLSGKWASRYAWLEHWRARQRTLPRLEACERLDAEVGQLRAAGFTWTAIGALQARSARNCKRAPERLARLALERAGRLTLARPAEGIGTRAKRTYSDPIYPGVLNVSQSTETGGPERTRTGPEYRPAAEPATDFRAPRAAGVRRAGYRSRSSGRRGRPPEFRALCRVVYGMLYRLNGWDRLNVRNEFRPSPAALRWMRLQLQRGCRRFGLAESLIDEAIRTGYRLWRNMNARRFRECRQFAQREEAGEGGGSNAGTAPAGSGSGP